jgi:SAM-dependent methyltransferase
MLVRRLWRRPRLESPVGSGPRNAVGGLWEEMGQAQLDFLVREGLRPHHRLLDVGCGMLRGGVKFIPYLERGNYYGIDIRQGMLDAGRNELKLAGITGKEPNLRCTDDFDVDFGVKFDYAIAQSVFTHVPLNSVQRCLLRVLAKDGRFYATFFENAKGKNSLAPVSHPQPDGSPTVTELDRDPYHYALEAFEWACSGTALEVRHVGEWGSLRGQKMLLFTRR